jgi:hypothetical protein
MGSYNAQQVCLNGHQITASYHRYPEFRKNFCDKCGEKTIYSCPECNAEVKGYYHIEGSISLDREPVPEHCHECGTPYPWTERKRKIEKAVASPDSVDPLRLAETWLTDYSADMVRTSINRGEV